MRSAKEVEVELEKARVRASRTQARVDALEKELADYKNRRAIDDSLPEVRAVLGDQTAKARLRFVGQVIILGCDGDPYSTIFRRSGLATEPKRNGRIHGDDLKWILKTEGGKWKAAWDAETERMVVTDPCGNVCSYPMPAGFVRFMRASNET